MAQCLACKVTFPAADVRDGRCPACGKPLDLNAVQPSAQEGSDDSSGYERGSDQTFISDVWDVDDSPLGSSMDGSRSADSAESGSGSGSASESAQTFVSDQWAEGELPAESGDESKDASAVSDDQSKDRSDQTFISDSWEEGALDGSSDSKSSDDARTSDQTFVSDSWGEGVSGEDSADSEGGDARASDQTFVSDHWSEDESAMQTLRDDALAADEKAGADKTFISDSWEEGAAASDSASSDGSGDARASDQTFVSDHWDSAAASGQTFVSDEWDEPTDKTIQSDDIAPEALQTMKTLWEGAIEPETSPRMTIKSNLTLGSSKQSLVIKPRTLVEATTGGMFNLDAEYELIKVLGEGGMGIVYDARQTSIDRSVAVKMLKPDTAENKEQRDKFLAEAVVTGDLDHPNIVPIYDVGSNDEGALFYSMKKVQGTPWLKVVKKKTLTENIEILMRVSDAVAFAHDRGVVHRDLKPENVMLGDYGEVLVMDWGLAQPTALFRKSSVSGATSMGGTPAYMAPEMATGPIAKIGPCSDVYLLGAILYEVITGHPPHTAKSAVKCLRAAAKNEIAPTDKTGELVDIALKAMATKIEDRHPSVQEFQAAIREYQSHTESIVLSTRAQDDLARAEQSDSYQDFAKSVFGFQEAYALWNGNTRAKSGITQAKLAYAGSAFRKGDLDLGASLLDRKDSTHGELLQKIELARTEREARQQRLKKLQRATKIGLAIFVVSISGALIWAYMEAQRATAAGVIANEQRDEAKAQTEIAEERRKEAEEATSKANLATAAADKSAKKAVAEQKIAEAARIAAEDAKKAEEYEAYIARIGLAAAKINENAFDNARELLNGCKPELRNWEWGRLMHLCSQSSQTFDTKARVDAVAISPDGTKFVSGSWNSLAQIWDAQTGQVLYDLVHKGLYVHAVAFSPDGKLVATGSNDKTGFARIWDVATGRELKTLAGHNDAVVSVTFSRDSKRLLTGSYDNSARLWDVETGKELQAYVGHNWWVWSAAFSPDEKQIVTASQDGTAIVWTTETGEKGPPFTGHEGPVYTAAYSPDGQLIVSGGYDKRVLVWRPDEVRPYDFRKLVSGVATEPPKFRALDGHTASVRSVSFSHDGKLIVSGSHDNTVRIWETETDKTIKTFRGHNSWVRSCAISTDGRLVLSGSHDASIRTWSIADYEEIRVLQGKVFQGHADAVLAAAFSFDGDSIVTASRDRTAKTWDLKTGAEKSTFEEGHSFLASTAVFFPNGKRLLTAAVDNTVRLWDVTTGTQLQRLEQTGRSAALALSHDAQFIATGSDEQTAKIWDAEGKEVIRTLKGHRSEVSALAFSPDDGRIITGDSFGRCIMWEVQTGKELFRLEGHSRRITAVGFLPDGTRVLTASGDKTVGQWDVKTGKEQTALVLKHPDSVIAMEISAVGHKVLTSCEDGKVRLWDADRAEMTGTLETGTGLINALAISRDGRQALTANSETRTVQLWDLDNQREMKFPVANNQVSSFLDLRVRGGLVWSAIFAPDGTSVLSVGGTDARLWDIHSTQERMSFSPHGAVASANFSPDGSQIITGSWDNSAKIWNALTGQAVHKLVGEHTGYVNSAVFSPDGTLVLTASDDKTAILWDARTAAKIRSFAGHRDRVRFAVFSPDGKRILTTSSDKTARVWDAETGQTLVTLEGHRYGVLCGEFSIAGDRIITGAEDNEARIWNAETGESLLTLIGHTASVMSVAFSPDGQRVLTGGQDDTARLWDSLTGKEILTLDGHTEEITSVSFSPKGKFVLTSSRDGKAIVWLAVEWKGDADPAAPAPPVVPAVAGVGLKSD